MCYKSADSNPSNIENKEEEIKTNIDIAREKLYSQGKNKEFVDKILSTSNYKECTVQEILDKVNYFFESTKKEGF
jgi:hypothetical protein